MVRGDLMAIYGGHSGVGVNRVTLAGSSDDVQYRLWEYQLNGGVWRVMSTSAAYNASILVTGLAEDTSYSYRVRAVNTVTNLTETSSSDSFKTLKNATAPSVTAKITGLGTNKFTITGTADYTCKTWQYQLNGGTWTSLSASTSATSVSKEITGLTPGTTYTVRVRATRTYNGVTGTSATVNATTVGGSTLNYVNTVNADAGTVRLIINWTIPATGYTHTLRIKDGGTTVVTLTGLTGTTGAETIELNGAQKNALLARMPNKTSFTGTFELDTFSGGSQVGATSSRTATVRTNEEYSAPLFDGWTHSDNNPAVTAVGAGYVKGLSDIRISCNTATARNGATISKYGITLLGKTVESGTTSIVYGVPEGCGEDRVWLVYVEDSRGYRTELPANIDIWCYDKPEVAVWRARRENQVGAMTSLYFAGTIRTITGNSLKSAQIRVRSGTDAWGLWEPITGLTDMGVLTPGRRTYVYDNDQWRALDTHLSHTVQIRMQDNYNVWSDPASVTVPRGIPLMMFRDGKVGVNEFNPDSALDVEGTIQMNGVNVMGYVRTLGDEEPLNDVTDMGFYFQPKTSSADVGLGYPQKIAGYLEVVSATGTYVLQKYYNYNATRWHIRTYYYESGWSAWKSVDL